MAEALVGGSILSAFLQVLFDRMASQKVVDFFKSRKLNHRLLEKLQTTMNSVNGLLDDAEGKQITQSGVKHWLDELRDAFYEADDLLDCIAYEATRLELETKPAFSINKVRNFFSPSNSYEKEMDAKLEEILEKLEYLVKQKDALCLREGTGGKPSSHRVPTTSRVDESDVYGRENDKEAIMKLLLSNDANGNNPGVISIVGMGGVGKTTLAQLVYNDRRVQEQFDLRLWVCVSEDFDIFKITKDIFKEATSAACDDKTPNQLQLELEKQLARKQFFLVLDDVWNEKYTDWDILRIPLKSGAPGSRILVTTRNENVASMMSTILVHHLNALTDDDCWPLLQKHAFDGGHFNENLHVEIIGKEIVRKCKGLPLTVKTLGGLLRLKRNVEDWKKILDSDVWDLPNDNILPALRLSYHYLPSHLKRCFAYCSIFPKDYKYQKEELILLWMAEGFLQQSKRGKDMRDVGSEYFDDLVSRSFFQKVSNSYQSWFIMHHLINDLARFVAGEFCLRLEGNDSSKMAKTTRHLSCVITDKDDKDVSDQLHGICGAPHLRTFILMFKSGWHSQYSGEKALRELLSTLKWLRVLSIPQCHNMIELPDSIGKLKHLRYLDLSETPIKRLPECLSVLYDLQALKLKGCKNLVELPANFENLINMCDLDIEGTELKEMPPNMSKLKNLQNLSDFFLGKQSGSGIEEIGKLQHLRGSLAVRNLQNVLKAQDALQANLKGKKHLMELMLEWKGDTDDSLREKGTLEWLQPHPDVTKVSIVGYGGTSFPNWVGDSSFQKLVSLTLKGCKYCSSLPPLGQLASLKYLSVTAFDGVMVIGPEFYGSCASLMKPFQSLEILRFEDMANLQKWIPYGDKDEKEAAFSRLRELYVRNCPELQGTLPGNLPSLTTLEVQGCHQLMASLPASAPNIKTLALKDNFCDVWLSSSYLSVHQFHFEYPLLEKMEQLGSSLFTNLEEVAIADCDSLKYFPLGSFPKLWRLKVKRCRNLQTLSVPEPEETCEDSISLQFQSLTIRNCPNFVAFPNGGGLSNLTKLDVWNCSKLELLPESMHSLLPSLVELRIFNCPGIESFPNGGLPFKLQSLQIELCKKLIDGRQQWGLQTLSFLTHLIIGVYEEYMDSFPEEALLPSTLISLGIYHLPNLQILDFKGFQRLTSLEKLTIFDCPKLQAVPEKGLPSTLAFLAISNVQLINKGLQNLTSLKRLKISECSELQTIPKEALPSTLNSLQIWHLRNLKSLEGLECLTSIETLWIKNCPSLQSLPEKGLPSSLSALRIKNCRHLKQRCQRGSGEDWPKISHIPKIRIS